MTDRADRTLLAALHDHPLEIHGRLTSASNAVFFGTVGPTPVVYKPVAGERPLWDFPTGDLASRERAAFLIDQLGGFDLVPPTVLHDGPHGTGMVQAWVTDPRALMDPDVEEDEPDRPWFVLADPDAVPEGMLPVFEGETEDGAPVVLAHADLPPLRTAAVFDAVIDNSDRKASHLLLGVDGRLWAIDHGVSLHTRPKLRTVLWGWAGDPIPADDLARVAAVREALADEAVRDELGHLLTVAEVEALTMRVDALLASGTHPLPTPDWPSVPWPPL